MKLLTLLDKTIKVQSLTTGMQIYDVKNNILSREALRVFEQQAKDKGAKTTAN